MTDWKTLRITVANDRGGWCEKCGCAPWEELHHCLVHKMKAHPELDSIYNLMAVCKDCHPYCNGFETRQKFWKSQCVLYGKDVMREWLDGLNLKVPPIFE
jgi:hypothetical protein